jgi:hypothetical protein
MAMRVKNVQAGYWAGGSFHPIRRSVDYDPDRLLGDEETFNDRTGGTGLKYARGHKPKPKARTKAKRGKAVRKTARKVVRRRVGAVKRRVRAHNPAGRKTYHWEIYNHKTGDTAGRVFAAKADADQWIRMRRAETSLKQYWRARRTEVFGEPIASARINPFTTQWKPAKVRRLPSGDVQVMFTRR